MMPWKWTAKMPELRMGADNRYVLWSGATYALRTPWLETYFVWIHGMPLAPAQIPQQPQSKPQLGFVPWCKALNLQRVITHA